MTQTANIVPYFDKEARYKLEFIDPYTEETRKLKKRLLIICLIAIAAATFNLQFSSYEAFSAELPKGQAGSLLLAAFFLTIGTYLFISFVFHAVIDYLAWNSEKENLELYRYDNYLLETNHYNEATRNILNTSLKEVLPKELFKFQSQIDELHQAVLQAGVDNSKPLPFSLFELIPLLRQQADDIAFRQQVIKDNVGALIANQQTILEQSNAITLHLTNLSNDLKRLNVRIFLKKFYFYLIDALVPVLVYAFALIKGYKGLGLLLKALIPSVYCLLPSFFE